MCEYRYQVLDNEITTFYADGDRVTIDVYSTFYDEKYLDIQRREKGINTGVIEVKASGTI
ncbi:hypothetical protein [Bacillus thuringiensis]|uniref:hypothetical protein n=1 Tax=Bacillus thuringiensis TaxID=1428 RepID=UPI002FFF1F1F